MSEEISNEDIFDWVVGFEDECIKRVRDEVILTAEYNYGSRGRKVAEKLGIKIVGTIGVLLQAHNEKMITTVEVKEYLNQLKNSNIRLSDLLIQEILSLL